MTLPSPTGSVCEVAEIPIEMVVGPEYVTGSSRMKSGTGQKLICNMISTRAAAPHDGQVPTSGQNKNCSKLVVKKQG